MKRLLLATVLLSTAMSDDILQSNKRLCWSPTTNDSQRVNVSFELKGRRLPAKENQRVHERQLWPRRESWFPQDNSPPGIDDLSAYATRVTPLLETGVLGNSAKLPPLSYVSRSTQFDTPRSDCKEDIDPTLLVTLDIRRVLKKDSHHTSACNSEKCRLRMERWKIQSPLYVEEPRWIEIQSDYSDRKNGPAAFTPEDPFLLSRGKKMMPPQNSIGGAGKEILDYDDFDDVRYQGLDSKELFRNRRTAGLRKFFEKRMDRMDKILEKKEDYEQTIERRKDTNYSGNFEHMQTYKDPFFLTRGKKMNVPNRRYERWLSLDDRLKELYGNKMTLAKKFVRDKRSLDSDKQNQANEMNDTNQGTGEVQHKISQETDKKEHSTNSDPLNSKKLLSDKDKTKFDEASAKLSDEDDTFFNSRGKRSSYDSGSSEDVAADKDDFTDERLGYNQWLKDLRGSVDGASYVDRRDKHADLKDILVQPFFISRGKKGVNFNDEISVNEERRMKDDYEQLALKMILNNMMEEIKCGSGMCGDDFGKTVKKKALRGRRGALDELLASYDPFFVARGKRSSINHFLKASWKPNFSPHSSSN